MANDPGALRTTFAHQSKVQEVFKSKHEMWKFLAGDGMVYLP